MEGVGTRRAAAAVERLIAGYRGGGRAPALRDRDDVAAYAAYRMPATFQAVRAALSALAEAAPGWAPDSHLDVGGGTGAAVWAAAAVWPDGQRPTVVLDQAEPALALGSELAAGAAAPAVRAAEWRRRALGTAPAGPGWAPAGLVTVSYVLGELPEHVRREVVASAAQAAEGAVVVVEPGTPEGYLRVLAARQQLVDAGYEVLAPCPHSARCPMEGTADWCHFAARVQRSALHRRVKGGELGHEDEKFSYVAAVRVPARAPAPARVVRHPQLRKGLVLLELCTAGEGLARTTVSKRQGPRYRAARDVRWGDAWPPPGDDGHDGA
ncbi:small ribosomal subunit Rsm22 family protein [Streptomyces sp. NBC_01808]|uniref:small ribosomal subunit Rsm22 family protein n=1 Tax=Streptomyces sp. NBC_01808 TaxID=2975947 RepID=UPI002DDC89F2|nr:small ribosomal subunit Rsm22 family protein [Streptomyces sp. NBC_01808]WSA42402.1 small ribosomal subunit Rsm22 family protein [Streptomyces sp. NBC_01808]